jgi:hypothetical protein
LFNDARLKVFRARHHTYETSRIFNNFIETYRDHLGVKFNPEDGAYYLHANLPAHPLVSLALSDALRCLRSALDYLVCALAREAKLSDNHTLFPFNKKRSNVEAMFAPPRQRADGKTISAGSLHAVGNVYPQFKQLILERIKPYPKDEGADALGDMLWRLITMDNIDKHRLITLTVQPSHIKEVRVGNSSVTDLSVVDWLHFPPFAFEGQGPDAQTYVDFTLDIAFPDDTRLAGQPVLGTLIEGADLVSEVIEMFSMHFEGQNPAGYRAGSRAPI